MSRPKTHYSMLIKNHFTGDRLKVELIDLPFTQGRQFRLRVNGQWARKVPVARLRYFGVAGEQNDRNQAGSCLAGETLGTFPPRPPKCIRVTLD